MRKSKRKEGGEIFELISFCPNKVQFDLIIKFLIKYVTLNGLRN